MHLVRLHVNKLIQWPLTFAVSIWGDVLSWGNGRICGLKFRFVVKFWHILYLHMQYFFFSSFDIKIEYTLWYFWISINSFFQNWIFSADGSWCWMSDGHISQGALHMSVSCYSHTGRFVGLCHFISIYGEPGQLKWGCFFLKKGENQMDEHLDCLLWHLWFIPSCSSGFSLEYPFMSEWAWAFSAFHIMTLNGLCNNVCLLDSA